MAKVLAFNFKQEVSRYGAIDMQVCVPDTFTDADAIEFAETYNPSGTSGWSIRREGSKWLSGHPERIACSDRAGCVHIMLDACWS